MDNSGRIRDQFRTYQDEGQLQSSEDNIENEGVLIFMNRRLQFSTPSDESINT